MPICARCGFESESRICPACGSEIPAETPHRVKVQIQRRFFEASAAAEPAESMVGASAMPTDDEGWQIIQPESLRQAFPDPLDAAGPSAPPDSSGTGRPLERPALPDNQPALLRDASPVFDPAAADVIPSEDLHDIIPRRTPFRHGQRGISALQDGEPPVTQDISTGIGDDGSESREITSPEPLPAPVSAASEETNESDNGYDAEKEQVLHDTTENESDAQQYNSSDSSPNDFSCSDSFSDNPETDASTSESSAIQLIASAFAECRIFLTDRVKALKKRILSHFSGKKQKAPEPGEYDWYADDSENTGTVPNSDDINISPDPESSDSTEAPFSAAAAAVRAFIYKIVSAFRELPHFTTKPDSGTAPDSPDPADDIQKDDPVPDGSDFETAAMQPSEPSCESAGDADSSQASDWFEAQSSELSRIESRLNRLLGKVPDSEGAAYDSPVPLSEPPAGSDLTDDPENQLHGSGSCESPAVSTELQAPDSITDDAVESINDNSDTDSISAEDEEGVSTDSDEEKPAEDFEPSADSLSSDAPDFPNESLPSDTFELPDEPIFSDTDTTGKSIRDSALGGMLRVILLTAAGRYDKAAEALANDSRYALWPLLPIYAAGAVLLGVLLNRLGESTVLSHLPAAISAAGMLMAEHIVLLVIILSLLFIAAGCHIKPALTLRVSAVSCLPILIMCIPALAFSFIFNLLSAAMLFAGCALSLMLLYSFVQAVGLSSKKFGTTCFAAAFILHITVMFVFVWQFI